MPITNSPEKFQIKVAISSDFFTALNKLPKAQYFKTIRLIESFKKNPISPGANYEKIANALDPDIHSLRVDDAYRCIVHKPRRGDVYLLLWVDRHDEAYAWAANRQCKVNPTGFAVVEGLAGAAFIVTGLLGLLYGGQFLQPLLGQGAMGSLLSAGTLPLLYMAVGLKVGAELAGLIARLAEYEAVGP